MSDTMTKSVSLAVFLIFLLDITSARGRRSVTEEPPETWTGRWLPERPTTHAGPQIKTKINEQPPMGVKSVSCDDGKTNLTVDWNGAFYDYKCMRPRSRLEFDEYKDAIMVIENIPEAYKAPHYCMSETLTYDRKLPTFGPHRPLWPKYGEYKFVPVQRWLHTLEHGGIVALYHPCADIRGILFFKNLVKNCLRRHVIAASKDVGEERPFVLLAWGVRLEMPSPDRDIMAEFIRKKALHGPERVSKDGQYDEMLVNPAKIVSDFYDSELCPMQASQNY